MVIPSYFLNDLYQFFNYLQDAILTSGTCCNQISNTEKYKVEVGDYNFDEHDGTESKYAIKDFVIHEDFDANTIENDICLIKLATPMILDGQM